VGKVDAAKATLGRLADHDSTHRVHRLAAALKTLIAAVKREPAPQALPPELATEYLAASYYAQSQAAGDASLKAALQLAREAADHSAQSGFAHARVAELELCFGRIGRAKEALLWDFSMRRRTTRVKRLSVSSALWRLIQHWPTHGWALVCAASGLATWPGATRIY
jgi:hypothetical protein